MPDEPYEFLRSVQLFADVSDKDLQTIAVSMRRRAFAAGLLDRSLEERLGEIALLAGADRTATVSAETDLVCWGMPAWNFRPMVREQPTVTVKLLEGMARQLAGVPRRD